MRGFGQVAEMGFSCDVFAERYERADGSDPTETYQFWIGQNVVASVDKTSGVVVSDSGGRVEGGWISA